ncbi:MAG: glycosyltransferase domain-containing protein [Bacteroidales bacterium]
MKDMISFVIGYVFGVWFRFSIYIYHKLFFCFRNESIINGLKKTMVMPGLIKHPVLQRGDSVQMIGVLNNKSSEKVGRKVVYSCVTGDYDNIQPLFYKSKDCDYILFTDNPSLKPEGWEVRLMNNFPVQNRVLLAKMPKVLPHRFLKEYDYSIWIDGNYDLIGDISELISYLDTRPLGLFPHSNGHKTIEQEALKVIELKKADPVIVKKQLRNYKSKGFPDNLGVYEAGILVRKHFDDHLMEVMEAWWHEIKNYSARDQLSLPYVLWKHKLDFKVLKGNNRKSELFVLRPHANL